MKVSKENYEEYLTLYVDNELTVDERAAVEAFAGQHPQVAAELELLKSTIFMADESVQFDDKNLLFRNEENRPALLIFPWKRLAVAAVLLLISGIAVLRLVYHPKFEPVTASRSARPQSSGPARLPLPQPAQPAPLPSVAKEPAGASEPAIAGNTRTRRYSRLRRASTDRLHREPNITSLQPADDESHRADQSSPGSTMPVAARPMDLSREAVDLAVEPRTVPTAVDTRPAAGFANEWEATDRIYVANTSIPKRNSLRGVFRKASRIIDRITTLQ